MRIQYLQRHFYNFNIKDVQIQYQKNKYNKKWKIDPKKIATSLYCMPALDYSYHAIYLVSFY